MQLVHIRGVDIAIETAGSGAELIVFLHGVGADRTTWKYQLPFFASQGYTCAAIDMRGSGDSQARMPSGEVVRIDRFEFANDVDEVIKALGFGRAHWVGNSMGGVIILEALALGISSIDRIVLSNTFAKHAASEQVLPRASEALRTKSIEQFASERIPMLLRHDIDAATRDEAVYAMARKDPEAYLATWRATWSPDHRMILSQIDRPTLVISSTDDMATPIPLSDELHDRISGSQHITIKDAGHLPHIDRPDAYNEIVLKFLKS